MSVFPDAIVTPPVKENRPGVVYDENDNVNFFAEDFNNLADEVVAIETALGENPEGGEATVGERIAALETLLGGIDFETGEGDMGAFNTYTGSWATITSKRYKYVRVGNKVDLWIRFESTSASSGLAVADFAIPSVVPQPAFHSNNGNSEWSSPAHAMWATTVNAVPTICPCAIYKQADGAMIDIYPQTAAMKLLMLHVTYFTS